MIRTEGTGENERPNKSKQTNKQTKALMFGRRRYVGRAEGAEMET